MGLEGFLKTVTALKFEEMAKAKKNISYNTVRTEAEEKATPPSFLDAMRDSSADDIGIIAEVKKASPSKGDIKPDLDPEFCANAYTKGGAKAISVLTETRYFKGSLKDLETVCTHTPLPVLRKDFTVSSYQIYEAKRLGAASILLITTMLSPDQMHDYINLAREIGMEPLVEITSEREFEIAYNCGAKVVDINNRNLQTLKTDLNVSKRISAIIPDDIIPVEASGISSFRDIEDGMAHNMFNFLVGESIVRSDAPEKFIRTLRNREE